MTPGRYRFHGFLLDCGERRLIHDGAPVELNGRYLDALALLVREDGRLVSKDRFMDQVWRGVPVTDEALTQCVRTLRRLLGDDASAPRFIETVPKHGYRFIAPVETVGDEASPPAPDRAVRRPAWRDVLMLGGAGTAGAALAGAVGGLLYGFAAASQPGAGSASVLIVLLCVCVLVAALGGAGVGFGIAAAGLAGDRRWMVAGGTIGGLVVGAVVKLLGLDAFALLFGRSPGDITGAAEGALLGGAVGFGAWLANNGEGVRRGVTLAGLAGGAAGVLTPLLGGRMLGGSLALLAETFPTSRLRLDPIGALLGEDAFGPVAQIVTGGLEGALFGGCLIGAMLLARRGLSGSVRDR